MPLKKPVAVVKPIEPLPPLKPGAMHLSFSGFFFGLLDPSRPYVRARTPFTAEDARLACELVARRWGKVRIPGTQSM
jgi:hypothetical protein